MWEKDKLKVDGSLLFLNIIVKLNLNLYDYIKYSLIFF